MTAKHSKHSENWRNIDSENTWPCLSTEYSLPSGWCHLSTVTYLLLYIHHLSTVSCLLLHAYWYTHSIHILWYTYCHICLLAFVYRCRACAIFLLSSVYQHMSNNMYLLLSVFFQVSTFLCLLTGVHMTVSIVIHTVVSILSGPDYPMSTVIYTVILCLLSCVHYPESTGRCPLSWVYSQVSNILCLLSYILSSCAYCQMSTIKCLLPYILYSVCCQVSTILCFCQLFCHLSNVRSPAHIDSRLSDCTGWSTYSVMHFVDPLEPRINCVVIREWLIALFLDPESWSSSH